MTMLYEQGIKFGDMGLSIEPPVVILTSGSCTIRILMSHFERLAKWYLEDQDEE
jgi:hypothetical protein